MKSLVVTSSFIALLCVVACVTGTYQPTAIDNPTVPFIREIPGGMRPGRVIYVVGVPSPRAARFNIELYCGPNCSPEDIPLHISVRFTYIHSNTVVLNAMEHGAWGKQELLTSFPFKPNVQFEIKIVCDPSSFKVYVNNQYFAEFTHRINMERATHIKVEKDTSLKQVRFEEQPLPTDYNNEEDGGIGEDGAIGEDVYTGEDGGEEDNRDIEEYGGTWLMD